MKSTNTQPTIPNGEILPRDYGIILYRSGRRLFISPSKYVMGKILLETPQEIRRRVSEKARREGYKIRDLEDKLKKGVRRREGDQNFLKTNKGERKEKTPAIHSVKYYAGSHTANIKSKSSPQYHEASTGAVTRCGCEDSFWVDIKHIDVVCTHIATLETALYLDNKNCNPVDENITGLPPRERVSREIPFTLANGQEESERLLTDVLFDYYVEGMNHYEINRGLIENPMIYSQWLRDLLENPNNSNSSAEIRVLRQEERKVQRTKSNRRLLGAIHSLTERLSQELVARGFNRAGYGLEFQGSCYEVVGQRFVNGNTLYSMCTREDFPPILVKKHLGEKMNLFVSRDTRYDSPFDRVGEKYVSKDDSTRRECLTEVIIPGMREDSIVSVPIVLKEAYKRAMSRHITKQT